MTSLPEDSIIRSIRDLGSGTWIKPPKGPESVTSSGSHATDLEERLVHAERLVADYQDELLAAQARLRTMQDRIAELEDQVRTLGQSTGIRPGGERDAL
ncbi:MAG: hypothetical protein FJY99_01425 [Candidatus Sericytochromatia bacterium]|nr:hypothetical protein [Candidatus Tanganyikabacteria bacterium]